MPTTVSRRQFVLASSTTAVGGKRLKGTILLFADREGSLDKMANLVRRLDIVAARVHAFPNRSPQHQGSSHDPWRNGGQTVRLYLDLRWPLGLPQIYRQEARTALPAQRWCESAHG